MANAATDPVAVLQARLHALVDDLAPDVCSGLSDPDAECDLAVVNDVELSALLVAMTRGRERFTQLLAAVSREWSQRRLWATDGSRSAGHRLARDANLSVAAAKQLLAAGAAAHAMPHVRAAWAAGTISLHHVALLADARSGREWAFDIAEPALVTQAAELRFDQTRKTVAYWKLRTDAELDRDGPEPICHPHAHLAIGYQGVGHLDATLNPVGWATFTASLGRIERELFHDEKRLHGYPTRTLAERNAAALVEMARRAQAAPAGGIKPDPLLIIVAGQKSAEWLCELSTGTVIHPNSIIPHLSQLDVQTIVFDGANRAVRASTSRCFTGLLRRVVQARDLHCQHPSGLRHSARSLRRRPHHRTNQRRPHRPAQRPPAVPIPQPPP